MQNKYFFATRFRWQKLRPLQAKIKYQFLQNCVDKKQFKVLLGQIFDNVLYSNAVFRIGYYSKDKETNYRNGEEKVTFRIGVNTHYHRRPAKEFFYIVKLNNVCYFSILRKFVISYWCLIYRINSLLIIS